MRQLITNADTIWATVALVMFTVFFASTILLTLTDRRKRHLDHMSQLPLQDADDMKSSEQPQ